MKIILTAVDSSLASAWTTFCGGFDFVEVHQGSIFDLSVDAVVSPANSFGFMDGGIDLLYSHRFGWHVQERLQELIATRHHGELLVGTADVVETDDEQLPFLIASPTMRVPMILRDSINPYLAARAIFLLIKHGTFSAGKFVGEPIKAHVKSIAIPGLGTGVGQVGANTCARQMQAAIEEVILETSEFPRTWAEAQSKHQQLYTDRIRDLQHDR